MGTEAQKLISVSLEKIATCRRRRREMSLHKNLLVTTVIQKARMAIMEETYYIMNNYYYEGGNYHQHPPSDDNCNGEHQLPVEGQTPPGQQHQAAAAGENGTEEMEWESESSSSSQEEEDDPDDKENVAPRGTKRFVGVVFSSAAVENEVDCNQPAITFGSGPNRKRFKCCETDSFIISSSEYEDKRTNSNFGNNNNIVCEQGFSGLRVVHTQQLQQQTPRLLQLGGRTLASDCSKQAKDGLDLHNSRPILAVAV